MTSTKQILEPLCHILQTQLNNSSIHLSDFWDPPYPTPNADVICNFSFILNYGDELDVVQSIGCDKSLCVKRESGFTKTIAIAALEGFTRFDNIIEINSADFLSHHFPFPLQDKQRETYSKRLKTVIIIMTSKLEGSSNCGFHSVTLSRGLDFEQNEHNIILRSDNENYIKSNHVKRVLEWISGSTIPQHVAIDYSTMFIRAVRKSYDACPYNIVTMFLEVLNRPNTRPRSITGT